MNTDYLIEDLLHELEPHPFDVKQDAGSHGGTRYTLIDPHSPDLTGEFLRFYGAGIRPMIEFEVPIQHGAHPYSWSDWTRVAEIDPQRLPIEAAAALVKGYLRAYNDQTAGVTA